MFVKKSAAILVLSLLLILSYAHAEDIDFDEIVFVKRMPYSSNHYYTDINNGTDPDRFLPGNGIFIYNLRTDAERPVVTAADMPGGKGFIGMINLSFDAKKILFDFRQDPSTGFRIWQINVNGSDLKQISFAPADEAEKVKRWANGWHTDDIHPCYLPNGRIIFSSTRSEHTVLCGGPSALVAPSLHLIDADGSNVEQITKSPVSEFCPVVLDDGRVMYHRWEYIDKGARVGKTIMSMYPDGTRPQELYGMGDDTTTVYMYPQQMPHSSDHLVCVGTCHYPQGGCVGSIMLINLKNRVRHRGPDPDQKDYRKMDNRYAVNNITPEVFVERRTEPGWHFQSKDGKVVHDKNGTSGHLFTHPWPISDKEFLVSYKFKSSDHYKNIPNAYGLYLIDLKGKRQLIHKDDELSCWHPTPLLARKVPPVLSSPIDQNLAKKKQALCIVTNIYQDVPNVEPGEIKHLRINEALPRYWSTGRSWAPRNSSSSWKAALWPRVQWGIVPVEADGSACFTVPADRAIFLQALDKDYREIQRERTYVNYRPGEIRSCIGCHGRSGQAPKSIQRHTPLALKRRPSNPAPQPCDLIENGGDGLPGQVIHYPTDIQPIFDAKCVSCHGNDTPDGDLKLTGDITGFYSVSYEQIVRKRLCGPVIQEFLSFTQGDRGNYNGAELPPKSLGAIKAPLIEILTKAKHPKNTVENHSKMLNRNELMIMVRWADTNYQFYGSYFGRQHPAWQKANPANSDWNPKNFRRKATFQEAISTDAPKWHR
jgi:hypothetical protein